MREVWSLPGYDVQSLLGFGATGEVWRAREVGSGDTVALKRLRRDADPVAVEALRREASLLRSLDSPYVVRLRDVVDVGTDTVLVLDHAAGGSLATLLSRRGSLDPGEVVTIAGPVAQALAAAHARGLVHGSVTPADVLFTGDGMPLLSDLGLCRVAGEERAPDPAADVWALAAACHVMLAGMPPRDADALSSAGSGSVAPLPVLAPSAPRALVAAVEAALVDDPAARPDAAAFASLLLRAHAAEPVRLVGREAAARAVPEVRPTPAAPRRRVPSGLLPCLGVVALLLIGGGAGWASGTSGGDAAAPLPPAAAAVGVGWSDVLHELDAARARAFALGDVEALSAVYAADSPGLAADSALLQQLVDREQTARDLRHAVRSIEVREESDSTARLRVIDVLGAYEILDAAGAVVSRRPARGEQAFVADLVLTARGWRLVDIRPES